MGLAANIITATEAITAATITLMLSTMPTAVMTESSENTMSTTPICTIVPQNNVAPVFTELTAAGASLSLGWLASTSRKISCEAL